MHHPLEAIPPDKRLQVFLPLLIATLVLFSLFRFIGPNQPYNIVDFELAGSVIKADTIVNAWTTMDRIHAGFSLGVDYLFMPLYSTTIGLACVWAASVLASRRRWWRTIGLLFAWGLWLAALFDAIENLGLSAILFGSNVEPWPQISATCATLKFGLIIIGLIYVAIGVVIRLINRSNPQPASP